LKNIVIFDFDGVLADTLDEMLHIVWIVCDEMGYPCEPSPSDLNALDRMEFIELGRHLGIPEARLNEFVERTFRLLSSQPLPPQIFPGMQDVVLELAKHHQIGLLTGNTFQVVDRFLETNNLSAAVAVLLCADTPGSRSEKLQRIITHFGRDGRRVYFIGDAVSDVRAAHSQQATSIAVTWGHQSEAKLRSAGPDYLVHTPQELLAVLQTVGVTGN